MRNKSRSQNSLNPKRGADFEKRVAKVASMIFGIVLEKRPIKIGNPPKEHRFDLVSKDGKYIIECKCYSWTGGGNIPAAKMAILNEAVFYLSHLSKNKHRFLIMKKDFSKEKQETLASYYFRINRHLLDDVRIFELDESTDKLSEIK